MTFTGNFQETFDELHDTTRNTAWIVAKLMADAVAFGKAMWEDEDITITNVDGPDGTFNVVYQE